MKVLIIGSKGFIGQHCVAFFSKEHEVWQCDVATDYRAKNYSVIDATNSNYDAIFSANTYDLCINCSGAANVSESVKNPLRDYHLNTLNVFRQLDAIRRYSPSCKYINLSSAAVYGNPQELPIKEEHRLAPISPYGRHKKMAEEICTEFYELYHIPTLSLRIFSAYGPGLMKQLFWDLYKKFKVGGTISLYGTGEESRDFIHIEDILQAINKTIKEAQFKGEAINVANGEELKIKDVVELYFNHLDKEITYVFNGATRKGDPINWQADITHIKKMGYSQKVSIDKGLQGYVNWLLKEDL